MTQIDRSRRRFLNAAACTAACGGFSTLSPQLSMLGSALAQSGGGTGYKALVCLYLGGGSDSFNMLIPTNPARHDEYVTARGGLYTGNANALGIPRPGGALPTGSLPAALALNGVEYGLNPSMPELRDLYNQGRVAFMANVGTIVEPTTKATINTRRRPPQLYSHSDQAILWDLANSATSSVPNGWGGMLAGRLGASNSLPGLPPCISIAGQTRFLVGKYNNNLVINPFRLSTSATIPAGSINNYSASSTTNFQSARRAALDEMLALTYPHVFSNEMADITERSLSVGASVNSLIGTGGAFNAIPGGVVFPNTSLGNQLAQVVRMIQASKNSSTIMANRQIFYVNTGGSFGWDSHNGQMPSNLLTAGHQGLLQSVSQAVAAFYRALVAANLHNEVMLFSASEFGRTINSNGEGTDHGWGGVQFVVGGGQGVPTGQIGGLPVGSNDQGSGPIRAYNPQTGTGSGIYGRYPRIINNASDSAVVPNAEKGESFSRGQFIPTTATEQYAATLARWMGLTDADVPTLFPNIDRYDDFTVAQGNLCAYTGRYVPFINGIS
jgi:uncharacterized protein (DUF1501 family)